MKLRIAILLFVLTCIMACEKKTKYSNIPDISSLGVTPTTFRGGYAFDTVHMSFHFTDGDGDIGNSTTSGKYDIYLIDSRTDSSLGFFFPDLSGVQISAEGLSGICYLDIPAAYFTLRPDHKVLDTVQYSIYLVDRADHKSNVLITPKLYLTQ